MQSLMEAQVTQMFYMLLYPRIRWPEGDTRLNAEVYVCMCVNDIWAS